MSSLVTIKQQINCLYYSTQSHIHLKIRSGDAARILFFFKLNSNLMFTQLIDLSFIDYLERKYRFQLFYNLLSIKYNVRVILSAFLEENMILQSGVSTFRNANWYEREAWDMFGLYFQMHPDFRRILTDYGFKGHPLRKDFPMTGYIEARYDALLKRIVYEELSLTQEYRIFMLENAWGNGNSNLNLTY